MLVVSHDRYFLNRLVDHIWELERTVLTTYRGNYSSYVVQKKERVERQLKEYEQQQEQIKSMEEFVAKNIARASTSKSAKSRLAALERIWHASKNRSSGRRRLRSRLSMTNRRSRMYSTAKT